MDGTIDFIVLEHDDVAGCALIAGAVDGVVPAIDGHNTPYVVAMGYDHATRNWEDCTLYDDIVKAKLTYEGLRGRGYPLDGAMRRDDSATLDIRGLTDAELAIEIEKAGAAMVEHVDAHMAHVHGLGGGDGDSAAYYAARKRSAPSPAHRPSSAPSSNPFAPISRSRAIRSRRQNATSRPTCGRPRSAASASRTRSTRTSRHRRRDAPHSAAQRPCRHIAGISTGNLAADVFVPRPIR